MKRLLKVLTSVWTRVILFSLGFGGLCYAYGINVGLKGAYYMYLQAGAADCRSYTAKNE